MTVFILFVRPYCPQHNWTTIRFQAIRPRLNLAGARVALMDKTHEDDRQRTPG